MVSVPLLVVKKEVVSRNSDLGLKRAGQCQHQHQRQECGALEECEFGFRGLAPSKLVSDCGQRMTTGNGVSWGMAKHKEIGRMGYGDRGQCR